MLLKISLTGAFLDKKSEPRDSLSRIIFFHEISDALKKFS